MQFSEWTSPYRPIDRHLYEPRQAVECWHMVTNDIPGAVHFARMEYLWQEDVRPYYKLWPFLLDSLHRIPLNVPLNRLSLAPRVIAIRLPIEHRPTMHNWCVNALLLAITDDTFSVSYQFRCLDNIHAMVGCQWNKLNSPDTLDMFAGNEPTIRDASTLNSPVLDDMGITFVPSATPSNDAIEWLDQRSLRIAMGVALLGSDPMIFERDVLAKDQTKWNETQDAKYVERAKRRGVNGWSLGRHIEMLPHWRRPHMGLRWTGSGRTVPRIVPIRGAIVHRTQALTVPTGHQLPDGTDKERA